MENPRKTDNIDVMLLIDSIPSFTRLLPRSGSWRRLDFVRREQLYRARPRDGSVLVFMLIVIPSALLSIGRNDRSGSGWLSRARHDARAGCRSDDLEAHDYVPALDFSAQRGVIYWPTIPVEIWPRFPGCRQLAE
jgi:hypothetical protein